MHGPFSYPAVWGAPRQNRRRCTCNSLLLDGHKNKFLIFIFIAPLSYEDSEVDYDVDDDDRIAQR